jgi:hypothetical protein
MMTAGIETPVGRREGGGIVRNPVELSVGKTAERVASISTRRRFLRRALESAFILGTSAALVEGLFTERAAATHTPCGASQVAPRCSCCGGGSACSSSCKKRNYGTNECGTQNNCWVTGSYLCCDCCCHNPCTNLNDCSQPNHTCRTCTNSSCGGSGTWNRCVCIGLA